MRGLRKPRTKPKTWLSEQLNYIVRYTAYVSHYDKVRLLAGIRKSLRLECSHMMSPLEHFGYLDFSDPAELAIIPQSLRIYLFTPVLQPLKYSC